MINWSRLPVLFVAAALCFGGAVRIAQASDSTDGFGLMAAGLVILGIWVTLEVQSHSDRRKNHDKDLDER